jgi:hypothetical protein
MGTNQCPTETGTITFVLNRIFVSKNPPNIRFQPNIRHFYLLSAYDLLQTHSKIDQIRTKFDDVVRLPGVKHYYMLTNNYQ